MSDRKARYSRYLLSIPMILENPFGLGMLEIDKYFPEPVHNIFISSFVNYGWLAGVAWILLTLLSFKDCIREPAGNAQSHRRLAVVFHC